MVVVVEVVAAEGAEEAEEEAADGEALAETGPRQPCQPLHGRILGMRSRGMDWLGRSGRTSTVGSDRTPHKPPRWPGSGVCTCRIASQPRAVGSAALCWEWWRRTSCRTCRSAHSAAAQM